MPPIDLSLSQLMRSSSASIEARVLQLSVRLRATAASVATKAPNSKRRSLQIRQGLMRESRDAFRAASRTRKPMAEITRDAEDANWADTELSAISAELALAPAADPTAAREAIAPLKREAGVEICRLLNLVDSLCEAVADAAKQTSARSDAETSAILHFTRHCRAVAEALGR